METKYFQFHKELNYPVFIKLESTFIDSSVQKVMFDLGFEALEEKDYKAIPLNRLSTKILTIKKASPRVAQQIKSSDSLDSFGAESLRPQGNLQVYTYRQVAMMVFSTGHSLWELGLLDENPDTEHLTALRVVLTRFTSWALGAHGVVGFWGVTTSDGFVVMKQQQSFGEAVFIDLDKKMILSGQSQKKLSGEFVIYRAEKNVPQQKSMTKEELVGFLTMNTTYYSFSGVTPSMRKNILEICKVTRGEYNHVLSPNASS